MNRDLSGWLDWNCGGFGLGILMSSRSWRTRICRQTVLYGNSLHYIHEVQDRTVHARSLESVCRTCHEGVCNANCKYVGRNVTLVAHSMAIYCRMHCVSIVFGKRKIAISFEHSERETKSLRWCQATNIDVCTDCSETTPSACCVCCVRQCRVWVQWQ